jgi:hypothetical protein
VREWITRHLGPAGQFGSAARGVAEVGHILARIPGLLQRAVRVAEQIDLETCRGVSLASEIAAWEREPRRPRCGDRAINDRGATGVGGFVK